MLPMVSLTLNRLCHGKADIVDLVLQHYQRESMGHGAP
jgi:hypothetical protein